MTNQNRARRETSRNSLASKQSSQAQPVVADDEENDIEVNNIIEQAEQQ